MAAQLHPDIVFNSIFYYLVLRYALIIHLLSSSSRAFLFRRVLAFVYTLATGKHVHEYSSERVGLTMMITYFANFLNWLVLRSKWLTLYP